LLECYLTLCAAVTAIHLSGRHEWRQQDLARRVAEVLRMLLSDSASISDADFVSLRFITISASSIFPLAVISISLVLKYRDEHDAIQCAIYIMQLASL